MIKLPNVHIWLPLPWYINCFTIVVAHYNNNNINNNNNDNNTNSDNTVCFSMLGAWKWRNLWSLWTLTQGQLLQSESQIMPLGGLCVPSTCMLYHSVCTSVCIRIIYMWLAHQGCTTDSNRELVLLAPHVVHSDRWKI